MIARTNVVIRHETNQLTGAVATYTGATRVLELTGEPTWQSGARQGKGQKIDITPYDQKMLVRGDAWARVPAKELGSATSFTTNRVAKPKTSSNSGTEEFADIYSDEYTIKTNQARFLHNVRIVHPEMNWRCDRMTVDSLSPTGKNLTLLAEGAVNFAMSSASKQPVHGTCERAEYTFDDTLKPLVDRMEMTGHPVLETTNAVLTNSIIIFDNTTRKVYLPGEYAMSGTANPFGTNSPATRSRKP
jgi:lipopolysaccharide export system protein LptA